MGQIDQLWVKVLSMTPDDFNKIVLALVAVVALIVGPFMQWLIARRQIKAQEQIANRQIGIQDGIAARQVETQRQIAQRQVADSISAKRQAWIDELRKDVSEFLTLFGRLEDLRRPAPNLSEDDQRKNFDEMALASARSTELGIRIKLRLNPKEGEHIEFTRLLRVMSDACVDPPPNETAEQRRASIAAFNKARDDVIVQLQKILKTEWERVKKGDL